MQSDKRPNPDRSLEALKAQLRALPQPPVPAHLEALLLASVPGANRISPRRWAARATLLAVASAVCVMAMLAWRQYLGRNNLITPVQGAACPSNPWTSLRFHQHRGLAGRPTLVRRGKTSCVHVADRRHRDTAGIIPDSCRPARLSDRSLLL